MNRWLALLALSFCAVSAQGGSVPMQGGVPMQSNIPVVLAGPYQAKEAAVQMPAALVLGGWQGGAWRKAPQVQAPWPVRWQVLMLGRAAGSAGLSRPATENGGPCAETLFTTPQTRPQAKARGGVFQVMVPAGLRAQPRPVTVWPNSSATYRAIVRQELQKLGFRNPQPHINTILRADLDGDGTQEVLIEASNIGLKRFYPAGPSDRGGQYSVVFLRYVRSGQAVTTILARDVQVKDVPQAEVDARGSRVMTRFGLAGVLDVNGDGRMEVVLASAYYEGLSGRVLEFTPGWRAAVVAEAGCGA